MRQMQMRVKSKTQHDVKPGKTRQERDIQCSTTTATSPDRRFFRGLSSEDASGERSRLPRPSPSRFSTRFCLRRIIVPAPPV